MHSQAWVALLQRIPLELRDSLVVVTSIGTEISIQSVLRFEDDYLVIRGRLAGTTASGHIFFIPFDEINHIGLQKELREAQIQAFYGDGVWNPEATAAAAEPEKPLADAAADATAAAPLPAEPAPAAAPDTMSPKSSPRLAIPSREAILQRLRARIQSGSQSGVHPRPPDP